MSVNIDNIDICESCGYPCPDGMIAGFCESCFDRLGDIEPEKELTEIEDQAIAEGEFEDNPGSFGYPEILPEG